MQVFDLSQVPHCVICGKEIRELSITWSSKYGGYICNECLRNESIDLMNENHRMRESLKKIKDLCESVWQIGDGQFYNTILEYAEEGLGES